MKRKHPPKKQPAVKIEEPPPEDYDEEEPTPSRNYANTQDEDVRTTASQYSQRSSSNSSEVARTPPLILTKQSKN